MFYHWTTASIPKSKIINVAIYRAYVRANLETENDCEACVLSTFPSLAGLKPPTLG